METLHTHTHHTTRSTNSLQNREQTSSTETHTQCHVVTATPKGMRTRVLSQVIERPVAQQVQMHEIVKVGHFSDLPMVRDGGQLNTAQGNESASVNITHKHIQTQIHNKTSEQQKHGTYIVLHQSDQPLLSQQCVIKVVAVQRAQMQAAQTPCTA